MSTILHRTLSAHEGQTKTAWISSLLGHLGQNALAREAHHASNLGEVMSHHGFQAGLLGHDLSKGRRTLMNLGMGPESLVQFDLAHRIGQEAGRITNPADRRKHLELALAGAHAIPGAEHVTLGGDVLKAMRHELAGTAPELSGGNIYARMAERGARTGIRTGMETKGQKFLGAVGNALPAVGLAAAMPEHVGMNALRWGIGEKYLGPLLARRGFNKGLRGEVPGKLEGLASDYLLSPALLDPQRAGNDVRALTPQALHPVLDEVSMHNWTNDEGRLSAARGVGNLAADRLQQHYGGPSQPSAPPVASESSVPWAGLTAGAAIPLGLAAMNKRRQQRPVPVPPQLAQMDAPPAQAPYGYLKAAQLLRPGKRP